MLKNAEFSQSFGPDQASVSYHRGRGWRQPHLLIAGLAIPVGVRESSIWRLLACVLLFAAGVVGFFSSGVCIALVLAGACALRIGAYRHNAITSVDTALAHAAGVDITGVMGRTVRGSPFCRKRYIIAAEWAARTRLHFGAPQDTPADRTVLARWVSRELCDKGANGRGSTRDSDVIGLSTLVPIIVELALLPTTAEVEAKLIRESFLAAALREAKGTTHM